MEPESTLEKIIANQVVRYNRLRDIIYLDSFKLACPLRRNQSGIRADMCFEITTHCNWECRNCFSESSFRNKGLSTPVEAIKSSIAANRDSLLRVNISGGEPFLHKEIEEILSLPTIFEGIGFVLTTNGSFRKQHIAQLKKCEWLVTVSLHGRETAHDHYTARRSFRQVMKGIDLLNEAGVPFHIYSVLHDYMDEDDLLWLSEYSLRAGAAFWRMIEPRPFGRFAGLSKSNLLELAKALSNERAGFVSESSYSSFRTVGGQIRLTN